MSDTLTELAKVYERACKELREEGRERGAGHVSLQCQYSGINGCSFWAFVSMSSPPVKASVTAPDPREAFEEALRRVTWERDVQMKHIAAPESSA